MTHRWKPLALAVAAAVAALALVACEKVANLDVAYDVDGGRGGVDGANGEGGPAPGTEFEGCPCDESAGLGCCMPKIGVPFCTSSTTLCASEHGIHLKCFRPDPFSESACCWHGLGGATGAGAVTALASSCDGGTPACTRDEDCAGTGKRCAMAACGADRLAFGMCAETPPPCP